MNNEPLNFPDRKKQKPTLNDWVTWGILAFFAVCTIMVLMGCVSDPKIVNGVRIGEVGKQRYLPSPISNSEKKYSPFLYIQPKDKKNSCSGFVISDSLAITAAHCLNDKDDYIVTSMTDRSTKVNAKLSASSEYYDIAVLFGDFTEFASFRISIHPMAFYADSTYQVCGIPAQTINLHCELFRVHGTFYTKIRGSGLIFHGMSGGPVIHPGGFVVGVIHGMYLDSTIIAPLHGLGGLFSNGQ